MSWNDPKDSGRRDPWGKGNGDAGPPDLDEVVRRLRGRFAGLFGGRGGGSGQGGRPAAPGGSGGLLVGSLVLALGLWALFGFYRITEGEVGVVLRFGEYHSSNTPGLHWRAPLVDQLLRVDMENIRSQTLGYRTSEATRSETSVPRESLMLTADENIVDVKLAVQYRIDNARDFLFNVRDPEATLKQVTESALREVVGKSRMEFILTEGRDEVASRVRDLVVRTLSDYGTGILITSMNMQDAQPPEQVQAAFFDVVKSREDKVRFINEAQAYRNDLVPKARGEAARILANAQAYQSRVVAEAEGAASRFNQVLDEYRLAPEVTRERLYIQTQESMLSRTPKVLMNTDDDGASNLFYLPLDKLMSGRRADSAGADSSARIERSVSRPVESRGSGLRAPRESSRGREPRR